MNNKSACTLFKTNISWKMTNLYVQVVAGTRVEGINPATNQQADLSTFTKQSAASIGERVERYKEVNEVNDTEGQRNVLPAADGDRCYQSRWAGIAGLDWMSLC